MVAASATDCMKRTFPAAERRSILAQRFIAGFGFLVAARHGRDA